MEVNQKPQKKKLRVSWDLKEVQDPVFVITYIKQRKIENERAVSIAGAKSAFQSVSTFRNVVDSRSA